MTIYIKTIKINLIFFILEISNNIKLIFHSAIVNSLNFYDLSAVNPVLCPIVYQLTTKAKMSERSCFAERRQH